MERRKRLRLDDVLTMLDTADDFDELVEEGSDDEFPDMVMEVDDDGTGEELHDEAAHMSTCKYKFICGNHNHKYIKNM